MKTSTCLSTFALALLSSTTLAAPTPQSSDIPSTIVGGPYGLMSIRSGSDIQYSQIAARDSRFWIGKEALTYCPADNAEIPCASLGNTTQVRLSGAVLSLDTVVPGGQGIYIGPKGALRFTEPHSSSVPNGSTYDGFTITEYASFGSINHAGGFVACPLKKGGDYPYQIYVQVDGFSKKEWGCVGFDLAAVNVTTPPAWEYL